MARIRTVKPEIHDDEAVGELSDAAFRLFIGLITKADDLGRLKGDPRLLGAQIWPYQEKSTEQIREWLAELDRAGLIQRYDHAGRPFICLPTWSEHQRIDNAGKSKIPPPDEADGIASPQSAANRGESPLDQGSRIKEGIKESAKPADAPLSHLLADLIAQNGSRRPRIGKGWLDAERLLLERDGRDRSEAERLIRWCQADEFWRSNILSMPKFREQYDKLRLQAQRRNGTTPNAAPVKTPRHREAA